MDKQLLRQVVGIDVAQKELVTAMGRIYTDLSPEIYAHKSFPNNAAGFMQLVIWVKKQTSAALPVRFVMEATGVYHESLAYFLDEKGYELSIVLPNKMSNYMRTLEGKTITDKTSSMAIAQFGLEKKLDNWTRPKRIFKTMRQLTRERDQIVQMRTIAKNQLHAEQAEAEPNPGTLKRVKEQIVFLNNQQKEVKNAIQQLVDTDAAVKKTMKSITTITGIASLTAATILGETNGFELIRNKRQLASYGGYDVREKQSGTSIKGKPQISKKGNRYLRKAMHMPALTAIRHDERFKDIFVRLVSKHGIKMKALVAVQRRLLEMTYTIYKTQKDYDKNYLQKDQDTSLSEDTKN